MNSVQINCFLEAAKYKSFSKAASNLFISQPTFSRNIAALEEELGISLFSRNSFHGIEMTDAGQVMLDAFTKTKKTIDIALEKAQRLEQNARLHLTLGLLQGQLLDPQMEDLIAQFRQTYPNVSISIRRESYQALMSALHTEEIDVAYMPQWQYEDSSDLVIHFITKMDTVLVIPQRLFPNAEDRIYSLIEFQNYPFINLTSQESQCTNNLMLTTFYQLGIFPPILEASSIQEQIQLVEMGEGIIIINPYNSICYSPNVHCIKIKELISQPFAVAWKKLSSNECTTLFQRFLQT